MSALDAPLNLRLPAAIVKKLAAAGLHTVGDLLYHAPRRYYHWGSLTAMHALHYGQDVTLVARVASSQLHANRQRGGVRFEVTLTDGTSTMSATFFGKNQYSLAPHQRLLVPGSTHLFAGKVGQYRGKLQLTHPQFEQTNEDDEQALKARHERPIPIYPLSHGLTPWVMQRAVSMVLADLPDTDIPELVDSALRERYGLLGHAEAIRLLHQPATDEDYHAAQRTLRWIEAYVLQVALRGRRAEHENHRSFPAPTHRGGVVAAIRSHLPYQLTDSQEQALAQISEDLAKDSPMMRLLQGDVGSGKTVVALLASAHMIDAQYQVAFLVPTEVLAEQHTQSLMSSIPPGVTLPIHLLTASTPADQRADLLARMEAGEPMVVVGTHALLDARVTFAALGLVIVDEQHRFGVEQRDRLRERFTSADPQARVPHQLVMTATPIPRTVAMTVFGDLEETRMTDLPAGRTPVSTYLVDAGNAQWVERMWQRASEEIAGGGRVYVVCPRIDADEAQLSDDDAPTADDLPNADEAGTADDLPTADWDPVSVDAHGAKAYAARAPRPPLASVEAVYEYLTAHPTLGVHPIRRLTSRDSAFDKARIMEEFASGHAPLLVSTTVIEVGVNVPQATMMVILDAQQFGLSQLHQLRGRVGRSDAPSVCMAVHRSELPPVSRSRLEAFAQTTDGFELAQRDVALRKEGDVLGADQSGKGTSLRFVSVVRDTQIITEARAAALATVEADPTLVAHPSLATHIRSAYGEETQWMEKA